MVAFSAGMLGFFLLAAVLTRQLGESTRAVAFMLAMAAGFALLLWWTVSTGRG